MSLSTPITTPPTLVSLDPSEALAGENHASRLKALYEIVRHGTYADTGHRAYMPNFTAERLSNAQVEDLRAYVLGEPN